MANAKVQVRRAYEDPAEGDGTRVLVDRIWPRGLTKARAALDEWCKDVAPSTELRKWYGHDPERFREFSRRYQAELAEPVRAGALAHLRELASGRGVTLLTATRRPDISEAAVLAGLLCDGRVSVGCYNGLGAPCGSTWAQPASRMPRNRTATRRRRRPRAPWCCASRRARRP